MADRHAEPAAEATVVRRTPIDEHTVISTVLVGHYETARLVDGKVVDSTIATHHADALAHHASFERTARKEQT